MSAWDYDELTLVLKTYKEAQEEIRLEHEAHRAREAEAKKKAERPGPKGDRPYGPQLRRPAKERG